MELSCENVNCENTGGFEGGFKGKWRQLPFLHDETQLGAPFLARKAPIIKQDAF